MMRQGVFLVLACSLASPIAAGTFLKWAGSDRHEELSQASSEMEAKTKMQIATTSMQDYLSQISELQFAEPTIAIPGQWLTDQKKAFLFLPIKIPKGMPLDEMKLLTDGKTILVNVVERPPEHQDDEATKKFRLVMEAFKTESGGDIQVLESKLKEWSEDEDNSEVRDLVRQTMDSLKGADGSKRPTPTAINIPLNNLELGSLRELIVASHSTVKEKQAVMVQKPPVKNPNGGVATIKLKGTYLQQSAATSKQAPGDDTAPMSGGWGGATGEPSMITVPLDAEFLQKLENGADYVVPLGSAKTSKNADSFLKESFSVVVPYPVSANRVFAVMAANGEVVVTMPYQPESVTAKSTSPFTRIPVFDMKGYKLSGPGPSGSVLSPESAEKEEKVSTKDANAVKPQPLALKESAAPQETREGAVEAKDETKEAKKAASAITSKMKAVSK